MSTKTNAQLAKMLGVKVSELGSDKARLAAIKVNARNLPAKKKPMPKPKSKPKAKAKPKKKAVKSY